MTTTRRKSTIQLVKMRSPEGRESEVVESAFNSVWEPRGYTLVEEGEPGEFGEPSEFTKQDGDTSAKGRRGTKPDSTDASESEVK